MLSRSLVLAGLAFASVASARPLKLEWPELDFLRYRMAYLGASLVAPVPSTHVTTQREMLSRAPFVLDGADVTPDQFALDLDALPPALAAQFEKAAGDSRVLSSADFQALGAAGYLTARPLPDTLAQLYAQQGIPGPRWDEVLEDSLITRSTRRIRYRLDVVLDATLASREVPPGTVFVAEDLGARGQVQETHVIAMRPDYRVDFALYDAEGHRRVESLIHPEKFQAPLSCFTCHAKTSQRPSPFWEFPDPAPLQEGFQPKIHETLSPGEARLVHRLWRAKQDSDVMGTYAGLAAVKLKRRAAAGPVEDWVTQLVKRVDAAYPSHP